ncbi:Cell division protein FtsL [Methylophaga thiooxydans]|uniref:Cell division protein FtsL n=1 Tax=Methylophaga thiooxydans TaxID=392484 RepID=A0A0A0BDL9_9GAMM|nr:cell division protein FtsL [Methylophaga thiooxydans]KGM06643.1 Cell division protein FtsL [Methylophaga thiooxydans]
MNLKMLFEHIRVDTPLIAMIVVVIISAVGVIYSKHLSRNEFIQLQQLEKQRDLLNEEWGRLLLEQSTWGSPSRVEQQASRRLQMIVPKADMTVVIKP